MEQRSGWLKYMTLIFIVAKLWGQVEWTWWQVFIPFYVDFGLNTLYEIVKSAKKRMEEREAEEKKFSEIMRKYKESKQDGNM